MADKALTIDNLGIDASSRYALDQLLLDKGILEESPFVGQKAATSALTPYIPEIAPEIARYLRPEAHVMWATLPEPPEMLAASNPLFTHQTIPSLGSPEKLDMLRDRLAVLKKNLSEKPEKLKEERIQEQQIPTIESLFSLIGFYDSLLSVIQGRLNQYQKG